VALVALRVTAEMVAHEGRMVIEAATQQSILVALVAVVEILVTAAPVVRRIQVPVILVLPEPPILRVQGAVGQETPALEVGQAAAQAVAEMVVREAHRDHLVLVLPVIPQIKTKPQAVVAVLAIAVVNGAVVVAVVAVGPVFLVTLVIPETREILGQTIPQIVFRSQGVQAIL